MPMVLPDAVDAEAMSTGASPGDASEVLSRAVVSCLIALRRFSSL